jgi:heat shock protein HtpX
MGAVGLQTHIWANNTRSVLLLAGFPVLMIGMIFGVQLILMGLGFLPNGPGLGDDMALAVSMAGGDHARWRSASPASGSPSPTSATRPSSTP